MQTSKQKEPLLRKPGVQTLLASLICILLGLLVGYIALLIINPAGATKALLDVIKNFWAYSKPDKQLKNFGITLVTSAPLLMCSLSVLFAYKVGLFNIGAAGQYVAGAEPAFTARWRCICPGICASLPPYWRERCWGPSPVR